MKKIVIIGSGFAGLKLAKKLNNNMNFDITLIDKFNFHQFQPLFYQVASARIEPSTISFPLRKVFQRSKNVKIRMAEVFGFSKEDREVYTSIGKFQYDYLIIATGCKTNYFGNKNIEEHAYPMKSTSDSLTIRNKILTDLEKAFSLTDATEIEKTVNIVIAGGGPTGVELSGAFAEMKNNVLPKDFPGKDFSRMKILLVEGSPNLLGPMSEASHIKSKKYLEDLGVEVHLNTLVKDYDGETVLLDNGNKILSKNLIWAAGITGNVIDGIKPESIVHGGRIKVNRYCQVENHVRVFALGDIASMVTPLYPKGHPQLASVAQSQASFLYEVLLKEANGEDMKDIDPYEYKDKGSMATVGKKRAVIDLPSFSFQGYFAWLFWMFLHLMLILNTKNKIFVFFNWTISYFSNDSTLRVIIRPTDKDRETVEDYVVYKKEDWIKEK